MKLTGYIIIGSIITAIMLFCSGAYLTIDNIIKPSGNLLEGIIFLSLGIIIALMLVVSSSIGTAIKIFSEIYTQQVDMQTKMTDLINSKSKPKTIGEILFDSLNLNKGDENSIDLKNSVTITDLTTGETTHTPLSDIKLGGKNNILDILNNNSLENLSIEELEKKLSEAVKNDEFEKANEIKNIIKNKREKNN